VDERGGHLQRRGSGIAGVLEFEGAAMAAEPEVMVDVSAHGLAEVQPGFGGHNEQLDARLGRRAEAIDHRLGGVYGEGDRVLEVQRGALLLHEQVLHARQVEAARLRQTADVEERAAGIDGNVFDASPQDASWGYLRSTMLVLMPPTLKPLERQTCGCSWRATGPTKRSRGAMESVRVGLGCRKPPFI